MKLRIWFAQYNEEHDIKSFNEIQSKIISFTDKHGLTSACWINFQINGEGNVKKEISYEQDLGALFG